MPQPNKKRTRQEASLSCDNELSSPQHVAGATLESIHEKLKKCGAPADKWKTAEDWKHSEWYEKSLNSMTKDLQKVKTDLVSKSVNTTVLKR